MSSSLSVSNIVLLFLIKENNIFKKKNNRKGSFHEGTRFLYKRTGYPFLSNSTIRKWNPPHTQHKFCLFFNISIAEFIQAVPPCKLKLIALGMGAINVRTLILFLSISGAIMLSSSTQKRCVNMSLMNKSVHGI